MTQCRTMRFAGAVGLLALVLGCGQSDWVRGTLKVFAAGSPVVRLPLEPPCPSTGDTSIRPFHVEVPEDALADLHRRLTMTRWPDRETVADRSQGVRLARVQDLVRYWATDYDWRTLEAKLNALPQFVTTIDDVDIQFVHVRSRHSNALPLLMTHGWPGSIVELLKVIGPLTDPTAYGGRPEEAIGSSASGLQYLGVGRSSR